MEYNSCREAIHSVRQDCSSLATQDERDSCMSKKNVHYKSENCSCSAAPLQCNISGNTQPRFACVPDSTEPQLVYGTHMQGKHGV